MSKYTIEVNDQGIERFLLNLINLLRNNPGVRVSQEGNRFILDAIEEENNNMLPGSPLSWDELIQEIEVSEEQFTRGEYKTSKQLRNEVKGW